MKPYDMDSSNLACNCHAHVHALPPIDTARQSIERGTKQTHILTYIHKLTHTQTQSLSFPLSSSRLVVPVVPNPSTHTPSRVKRPSSFAWLFCVNFIPPFVSCFPPHSNHIFSLSPPPPSPLLSFHAMGRKLAPAFSSFFYAFLMCVSQSRPHALINPWCLPENSGFHIAISCKNQRVLVHRLRPTSPLSSLSSSSTVSSSPLLSSCTAHARSARGTGRMSFSWSCRLRVFVLSVFGHAR